MPQRKLKVGMHFHVSIFLFWFLCVITQTNGSRFSAFLFLIVFVFCFFKVPTITQPPVPEAEGKVESDSAENSETHNPPAHVELEEEDSAFPKRRKF